MTEQMGKEGHNKIRQSMAMMQREQNEGLILSSKHAEKSRKYTDLLVL